MKVERNNTKLLYSYAWGKIEKENTAAMYSDVGFKRNV